MTKVTVTAKPKRSVRTPAEVQEALILRSAGHSIASISQKTGMSVSTVERHIKSHKIIKGVLTDQAIQEAQTQLISETTGDLRIIISSVLKDDVAQFHQIRAALSVSVERLVSDSSLAPHQVLRGLAAAATTLKLSGEVARRALKIDEVEPEQSTIPILEIVELTANDIAAMRQAQLELSGDLITDAQSYIIDDDIIEEA